MEIERKFRVDGFLKDLPLLDEVYIEQGYLSTNPVVRIRSSQLKEKVEYYLTIKGKGTIIREEVEFKIKEDEFLRLKNLLNGHLLKKELKIYSLGNYHLECSRVSGNNIDDFFYAEIEFSTLKEAENFIPPKFLGKELTYDTNFTMSSIWKKSISS